MVTDNHSPDEQVDFHFKHRRAEHPEWCKLCWAEEQQDECWDDEGGRQWESGN